MTSDETVGNERRIQIQYNELLQDLNVRDISYIDIGRVVLEVIEKMRKCVSVICW